MSNFVHWSKSVYDEFIREAALKPREEKVMYLHVFTDLNYEQMGDRLGYSANTVRADIRRCKDKYRRVSASNQILRDAIYK